MSLQAISFVEDPGAAVVDPNRMDCAMFVGFLPLRAGSEALAARQARAARLSAEGWADRIAGRADLLDLPVRLRSLDEAETLFDTGGRQDRAVRLAGGGLAAMLDPDSDHRSLTLSLDGVEYQLGLQPGALSRDAIIDQLQADLTALDISLSVALGPVASGFAPLVFTLDGPGDLTIYANPALGFPVAARSASGRLCCPMGAALRLFFAAGGREAVVVRMGDPLPYFADISLRLTALSELIGGNYGAGATALQDLLASPIPALPPAFPTRSPWHGLAHLHGLPDISMVLMPDLPDLLASEPPLELEPDQLPRPREVFSPCAPDDSPAVNGQTRLARPISVGATGLELWTRLTAWAAEQTARITPEAMVLAAPPWTGEGEGELATQAVLEAIETGNSGAGLGHPQLQIAWPWVTGPSLKDAPASAAPASGLLAGIIAAGALSKGAWRSVAGRALPLGHRPFGGLPGLAPQTAAKISLLGYGLRGAELLSDHSPAPAPYRQAHIRRLMALILRAARHRGETDMFEPNGQALWRSVSMTLTTLLRQLYSAGALRGASEAEAFDVRCGPSTMSQADIDAGRAIAEVAFLPAASLEQIEIRLSASAANGASLQEAKS